MFESSWANLQLVDFNKDTIFEEALNFLRKKKLEEFYFLKNEKPTEEDFDMWHQLWKDLWEITRKYVEKKKNELFEYEFSKKYYYRHLAANVLIYYLLKKSKIKNDLKQYISEKIIKEGYFLGSDVGEAYMMWRNSWIWGGGIIRLAFLPSSYLALKWFYNEKTKKYYSEELLKEIREYEDSLKDSMDSDWRKKIEETGKKFKYKLRA